MQERKSPRDFVYLDEFWEADDRWPHYFIDNKVWMFVDEYRAELTGDEDYSRIIVHSGGDKGWLYSRTLSEKPLVIRTLDKISRPVSEKQLETLGFSPWSDFYI